jgi:hypothetical protein
VQSDVPELQVLKSLPLNSSKIDRLFHISAKHCNHAHPTPSDTEMQYVASIVCNTVDEDAVQELLANVAEGECHSFEEDFNSVVQFIYNMEQKNQRHSNENRADYIKRIVKEWLNSCYVSIL